MNIVALMKDENTASAFRTATSTVVGGNVDVHVRGSYDPAKQTEIVNGHDILFYDIECEKDNDTIDLSRFISNDDRRRPVIVTANNADPDDVRRLLGFGVIDVLTHPIRETDLIIALDRAERALTSAARGQKAGGKIVSFLKGGGGVGATTLAVQGGALLADDPKAGEKRVCLIDFDIQFGTAALYLDLQGNIGLEDLMERSDQIDSALLESTMLHHASGLDILASPKDIVPLDTVTPDFATTLLDVARQTYDITLLDLPHSWTPWTYAALSKSDVIIVVSQLSVSSVRQAVHQVKTLQQQDLANITVKHVLNRYRRTGLLNSAELKDAEKALGRKYDFKISNDYELVSESVNRGVMLSRVQKRSKTAKDIRNMMTDLEKFSSEFGLVQASLPAA